MRLITAGEINELVVKQYEHNVSVGWWTPPQNNYVQKLQLVSNEVAECIESLRKNLKDDKLTHRLGAEVELADALLRMFDIAGAYGWKCGIFTLDPLPLRIRQDIYNEELPIGARVFILNELIVDIRRTKYQGGFCDALYTTFIQCVLAISDVLELDVIEAMYEKIEFNRTRPDHDPKNRLDGKEGSKSW